MMKTMADKIILDRLETECLIGIFDWERKTRQKVQISLELDCDLAPAAASDNIDLTVNYKSIAKDILKLVEPSEFFLIETMAERIAALCLGHKGVMRAQVTVSKPGAIRNSRNISVRIIRENLGRRVFLGIGGNIDPERHISRALDLLRSRFDVLKLSPVYVSEAWGVKEKQPDYHNMAVEIKTEKDIFSLRGEIALIEKIVGRKRTEDKFAPRPIDIDLLMYGDVFGEIDAGGRLPHPQLVTQQFVYMPMIDIVPDLIIPGDGRVLADITPEYDNPELRIHKLGEPG